MAAGSPNYRSMTVLLLCSIFPRLPALSAIPWFLTRLCSYTLFWKAYGHTYFATVAWCCTAQCWKVYFQCYIPFLFINLQHKKVNGVLQTSMLHFCRQALWRESPNHCTALLIRQNFLQIFCKSQVLVGMWFLPQFVPFKNISIQFSMSLELIYSLPFTPSNFKNSTTKSLMHL